MKDTKPRDLLIGLAIVAGFILIGVFSMKTPNLKPLKILNYGPNPVPAEVKSGAVFNVWISAENISYSCRVLVNGAPVKSVALEQPSVITATVAPEYVANGRPIRLQIIDPLTNRKSDEFEIQN